MVVVVEECGIPEKQHLHSGLRELHTEINMLVLTPSIRHAITSNFFIINQFKITIYYYITVAEVDDNAVRLAVVGESIAVAAHMDGGGHLGEHVRAVELHGVITRLGGLVLVREGGTVAGVDGRPLAGEGHHEDVAVVGAAGAAEVGMRESVHHVIVVVVARAAVPPGETSIGTELDGPEGNERAGESVAMCIGADEGVDVLGIVLCHHLCGSTQQKDSEKTEGDTGIFHLLLN